MTRPHRSDAHLPLEEEAKIEEETRHYFEDIAPKRHTKPSRSEYSSLYSDKLQQSSVNDSSPEFDKLRNLEADSQKLVYNGSEVTEEYAETEYYKDLDCIDKQHHTTGTGFIEIEKSSKSSYSLTPDCDSCACHPSSKGNPATNEWIPSADSEIPASHKPSRSDI